MPKKILLLGSTGSIGARTLDVIRDFPEQFTVCGLSTFGKTELLEKQVSEFKPLGINVTNPEKSGTAKSIAEKYKVRHTCGMQGLKELIDICEPDIVAVATVGIAGLEPTLTAINKGCDVALANKEALVTGGTLVMKRAAEKKVRILPIDSEHNGVAQCLMGQSGEKIKRIILTASGGPFRTFTHEELKQATPDQALSHPTWQMGPKITIDSATLMNKGFEVIEGHHLFNMPLEKIDVLIHPQSIIHALVEFIDGSHLAQISITDMYLTIQSALTFPKRFENSLNSLDLSKIGSLTFEKPDVRRFPCLSYAFEAARTGGTAPVALNAANEVAVRRFLQKEISFCDISRIIRETLDKQDMIPEVTLEAIREADKKARKIAEAL